MSPFRRWVYRATLKLVEVSLGNHAAVSSAMGDVCATCRPVTAWPCKHYVELGARAAELRSELEAAR